MKGNKHSNQSRTNDQVKFNHNAYRLHKGGPKFITGVGSRPKSTKNDNGGR